MSTAKTIFIALPFVAFAFAEAWTAEPIHFVKRSWDDASKKVVETDMAITEYTVLSGNFEKKKDTVKADTWYVVKGTVTRLSVFAPPGASGNLVICDGATLKGQIAINEGSTLNIYGQEHDSGKIQAESVELVTAPENLGGAMESPVDGTVSLAAIGGGWDGGNMGTLVIHGGSIIARSEKPLNAEFVAGIGGGRNGNGGSVTIYGGTVKAYGGKDASGIGSAEQLNGVKHGGTLTVYGGTVEAHGGKHGAGIGGGQDASGSKVTVYGGDVFADGTGWGAGIGGGEDSDGADVKIYGGKVVAWAGADAGKKNGSAIGSEDGNGHYGKLYIADGLRVWAGQSAESTSLFPYETRVPACRWRPYARIEPDPRVQQVNTDAGNILKKSAASNDIRVQEGRLDAVHSIGRHADLWFDLQGRKLNGRPADQGKYLHNGKVEVVR